MVSMQEKGRMACSYCSIWKLRRVGPSKPSNSASSYSISSSSKESHKPKSVIIILFSRNTCQKKAFGVKHTFITFGIVRQTMTDVFCVIFLKEREGCCGTWCIVSIGSLGSVDNTMMMSNINEEARPRVCSKFHLVNILDIKYDPCIRSLVQAPQEVIAVEENQKQNEGQKQKDPTQEQHQQQEIVEPSENTPSQEEISAQIQEKLAATSSLKQISSIQQQLQKENPPLFQPSHQALILQPNDYQICKNLIRAVAYMRFDLQAVKSVVSLMKELRKRPLALDRNMAQDAQQNENNGACLKRKNKRDAKRQKIQDKQGRQEQNQGNHQSRARTSKTTRRRFNKLMNRDKESSKETAENKNIDQEVPNKEVRRQQQKKEQLCSLQNK